MIPDIEYTMAMIRMQHQGENPEPYLERVLEQEQQQQNEQNANIAASLRGRGALVSGAGREILEEMESNEIFKPAEQQSSNLKQALGKVEQTQKNWTDALNVSQKNLEQLSLIHSELASTLQNLQSVLKSPKPLPCEEYLRKGSEAFNRYIAAKTSRKIE